MRMCTLAFILLIILGPSGYAQDSVQVKVGWNIIGSVKAGAVPDVLTTFPDSIIVSSFFGYAPGVGYEPEDTLGKGYGYWVKVAADGIIVFGTVPAIDSCKSKAFVYEGKLYNTVKIGYQCWMAENLDVGTMVDSLADQTDNDTTEKYCYKNDPLSCALFGGLYQWREAMQHNTTPGTQGICPPGWHIPTDAEFQTLSSAFGGDGNALKANGQGTGAGGGTNTSGFSALLAGGKYEIAGGFASLGIYANFWSSTPSNIQGLPNRNFLGLYGINGVIDLGYGGGETEGYSVRCLQD